MDVKTPAGPGPSRANRALTGWLGRRNLTTSSLGVVSAAGLLLSGASLLAPGRENLVPFTAGLFVSLSGLFVIGHLRTAPFLLARPVTRRQVYNASLLAGLYPWFLLAVLPAVLYALFASRVPERLYLGPPVLFGPELALGTLVLYLISACIGLVLTDALKNAGRPWSGWSAYGLILLLTGWAGITGGAAALAFHLRNWAVPAAAPAVIAAGLALAVIFYQAGWCSLRRLDF